MIDKIEKLIKIADEVLQRNKFNVSLKIKKTQKEIFVYSKKIEYLKFFENIFSDSSLQVTCNKKFIKISPALELTEAEFELFNNNFSNIFMFEMLEQNYSNQGLSLSESNHGTLKNDLPKIHRAILTQDASLLETLLQDVNLQFSTVGNFPGMEGFSLYHTAAKFNYVPAIRILSCYKNIPIDRRCAGINPDMTALHVAILNQSEEAVQELLEQNASVTTCCNTEHYPGYSALMLACVIGNLNIIKMILKKIIKLIIVANSYEQEFSQETTKAIEVVEKLADENKKEEIAALLSEFSSRCAFYQIKCSFMSKYHHYDERDVVLVKFMELIHFWSPDIQQECLNRSDEQGIPRSTLKVFLNASDESIVSGIAQKFAQNEIAVAYTKKETGFCLMVVNYPSLLSKLKNVNKMLNSQSDQSVAEEDAAKSYCGY